MFRHFKGRRQRWEFHHRHFLAIVRTDPEVPGWHGKELWFTHSTAAPANDPLTKHPILVWSGASLSEDEKASLLQAPEDFMKSLLTEMLHAQCP
jgi:hypothetical protein